MSGLVLPTATLIGWNWTCRATASILAGSTDCIIRNEKVAIGITLQDVHLFMLQRYLCQKILSSGIYTLEFFDCTLFFFDLWLNGFNSTSLDKTLQTNLWDREKLGLFMGNPIAELFQFSSVVGKCLFLDGRLGTRHKCPPSFLRFN